jgi:hypothetical protein
VTFDFASLKAKSRRIVHDTLAVDAKYRSGPAATPVDLRVRWHYTIANTSAPETGQTARQLAVDIEGPERVVFDREELAEKGINPVRAATVEIPAYGVTLQLETAEPITGPIDLVWIVVRP